MGSPTSPPRISVDPPRQTLIVTSGLGSAEHYSGVTPVFPQSGIVICHRVFTGHNIRSRSDTVGGTSSTTGIVISIADSAGRALPSTTRLGAGKVSSRNPLFHTNFSWRLDHGSVHPFKPGMASCRSLPYNCDRHRRRSDYRLLLETMARATQTGLTARDIA